MNNSNFDNLTNKLSESEKKSLLNQISENLSSNPIEEDQKYSNFREKENRDYKIRSLKKDIEGLGFLQRMVLNIRGFVMGKDIVDVHNHDLIIGIEKRIQYSAPNLVDVKKRRFTSLLIGDFLKINSLISPFIEPFSTVWDSPIALERVIGEILAEKYNSIKNKLYDFITESEIDKYIAEGENIDTIKKRLLKSIYDYRKKIPDYHFPEVEEELMNLIALKNIVLYNYAPMFKLMGISADQTAGDIASKSVSMNLVVKHIEEFYKLVIHFSGNTLNQHSIDALMAMTTYSDIDEDENQMWQNFNDLSEKLKSLAVKYPFEDLIRFSRNNPFYKIDYSVHKINVSDFYFNTLKKEMISELSSIYKVRELTVVDTILEKTFTGFDFKKLVNYAYHKDFDYKKYGLNYFKYIDSISTLYNFIKYYYLKEYKDILFIVNKQILEKAHVLQTRSIECTIGIENLFERIVKFDKSLSAEGESGKTMRTLFSTVAGNRQNIRMYKAFIKQKDDEVEEFLKLGLKIFNDMVKIMQQTIKNPTDNVKLQVSAIHPSISRKITVKDILIEKSAEIQSFADNLQKKVNFESQIRQSQ